MAEVSLNTGVSQVRATSDVLYAAAKTKNLLRDAIIDQQGFEAILYSSFTDQNTRDLFGEISYNLQRTKTTIRFIPDFKQYMAAVDFYQAGAIRENEKIPLKAKVRSDLNIKTGDILSYAFSYFESTLEVKFWEVTKTMVYSMPVGISKYIVLVPWYKSPPVSVDS